MSSGTDKKSEAKADGITRKWSTDNFNGISEPPATIEVQRTGVKSLTFTAFLVGTLVSTLKRLIITFIVASLKDLNTRK